MYRMLSASRSVSATTYRPPTGGVSTEGVHQARQLVEGARRPADARGDGGGLQPRLLRRVVDVELHRSPQLPHRRRRHAGGVRSAHHAEDRAQLLDGRRGQRARRLGAIPPPPGAMPLGFHSMATIRFLMRRGFSSNLGL